MNNIEPEKVAQDFWGISPENVIELSGGQSTRNWKVTQDGEDFVLRNAGLYPGYVDMQIGVLQHLKESDFPYEVPQPLDGANGDRRITTELGNYMLYPFIHGETGLSDPDYSELGILLGAYHSAMRGYDFSGFTQRRSKDLLDTQKLSEGLVSIEKSAANQDIALPLIERAIACGPLLRNHVEKISTRIHAIGEEQIVCHGDPHLNNVVFSGGHVSGLIDFGGITVDPPITDVAASIARLVIVDQQLEVGRFEKIIAGYKETAGNPEIHESVLDLAFLNTLRSFIWQISELAHNPETRITTDEAEQFLDILIALTDIT
ncbi:MAG: aminoglycoside phosphotransferase family protein [Candidatus Saccharibacteria bacterium]